jgi:hypothetical protein
MLHFIEAVIGNIIGLGILSMLGYRIVHKSEVK